MSESWAMGSESPVFGERTGSRLGPRESERARTAQAGIRWEDAKDETDDHPEDGLPAAMTSFSNLRRLLIRRARVNAVPQPHSVGAQPRPTSLPRLIQFDKRTHSAELLDAACQT